jgi:hypothetical protein
VGVSRDPGDRGDRGDGEGDVFLIGRLIFNTVDDLRAAISGEYRAVTRSAMDNSRSTRARSAGW